jgi:ornithine cyclodeaminase/alanine dehydrogenase
VTTLTWLDSAAVRALMPTVEEQLDLVAETYVAMARGRVELPPKPGLHPREDSFLNAMPAWLMDRDVVAMKWVSAYPGNPARGLPAISGLVVVNDPDTGAPEVVMDAAEITAVRTAVASGVAIRHLAPAGWQRVAILGYGAQGRSHAEVVRTLRPDAEVVAWGPRLEGPVEGVTVADDPRAAVAGADVVVTAGPMPRERRPVVATDWLEESCLVLPVDYDARVLPEVSHAAADFLVDDLPQFGSFVERGSFAGWAAPGGSLGEALQREPVPGRTLVCSLGVGAVDAVIAGVVRDRERTSRLGVPLPR